VPLGETYQPSPSIDINMVQAQVNDKGAFTSVPLLPGVYRVYVVESASEAQQTMADPDFRQSQEKAFPPVKVVLGNNAPLQLVLPAR
jgi:hypothetical protein